MVIGKNGKTVIEKNGSWEKRKFPNSHYRRQARKLPHSCACLCEGRQVEMNCRSCRGVVVLTRHLIEQEAPATRKGCDAMSLRMRGVNLQFSIFNLQSTHRQYRQIFIYRIILWIFILTVFEMIFVGQVVYAHGSFYPHHLKDIGAIKDNIKEMRGKVIVTTIIFVAVLTGVIVLALRKGNIDKPLYENTQSRLKHATLNAAQAAQAELAHDALKALRSAVAAYARSVGVPFSNNALSTHSSPITCKIREDKIFARIIKKNGVMCIEIRAMCGTISVTTIVDETGGIDSRTETIYQ